MTGAVADRTQVIAADTAMHQLTEQGRLAEIGENLFEFRLAGQEPGEALP